MLKKVLFVATTAIVLASASSLPASASLCTSGNFDAFGQCLDPNPQPVPEPSAILGTLLVGAFIGKKALESNKVTK